MPAQRHMETNTEGWGLDRGCDVDEDDFSAACLEMGLWTRKYHQSIKHQTKMLTGDTALFPSSGTGSASDPVRVGASGDAMVRLQESSDASTRLLLSVRELRHALIRQAETINRHQHLNLT